MTVVHVAFKLSEDDVTVIVQALEAFRRGRRLEGVTVTRGVQHDSHQPVLAAVVHLLVQAAAAREDGADPAGTQEGEVNQVHAVDEAYPVPQVEAAHARVDLDEARPTRRQHHLHVEDPGQQAQSATAGHSARHQLTLELCWGASKGSRSTRGDTS